MRDKARTEFENCRLVLTDINEEIRTEIVYNARKDCGNVQALSNFKTLWDCLCSASPLFRNVLKSDDKAEGKVDAPENLTAAIKEGDRVFRQEYRHKEARTGVVEMQRSVSRLLVILDTVQGVLKD